MSKNINKLDLSGIGQNILPMCDAYEKVEPYYAHSFNTHNRLNNQSQKEDKISNLNESNI